MDLSPQGTSRFPHAIQLPPGYPSQIVAATGRKCPESQVAPQPALIDIQPDAEFDALGQATHPFAGDTSGNAGDAVQYVVTLRNNSGVNAFDVTFSDTLPLRTGTGLLIASPSFSVADLPGSQRYRSRLRLWRRQLAARPDHQAVFPRTESTRLTRARKRITRRWEVAVAVQRSPADTASR
ncbi:MAG: DUF11 domain-containing protein [Pirellulaceae bacterium]